MPNVFGIDLGTTYSCISEISTLDKLPVVLKNAEEMHTTPSVVFFDQFDTPIVGGEAKRNMQSDPSRAVAFIKREMSNKSYSRTIGTFAISPVKISAMILKKLVDDANLNRQFRNEEPIHDVVITVPAYFGNNERELTRQAGQAAGLNVLALLNEPTAAALSYGANKLEGKTFMIYDLGGGTFDISIMKVKNGNLETLSTDGDQRLGGVDWDVELVNLALRTCCNTSETYEDIKNTREGGAIILAAEQCKKFLSTSDEAPMRFRYKNRMYIKTMRRSTFEELTERLLDKTVEVVRHAMAISTIPNPKIDEIILVGGSSYMPMVRRRLTREFPGVEIKLDQFEPDLAVAKGAAIHAHNLQNPSEQDGVKITKDLSSRSYGTGIIDFHTDKLLIENLVLRTDPMVFEATSHFQTKDEGQTSVRISIYENVSVQRTIPRDEGTLISSQTISWGYPVPKATPITHRIKRGSDGIIHIEVECQKQKIYFEIKPDMGLSKEQIESLSKELKDLYL